VSVPLPWTPPPPSDPITYSSDVAEFAAWGRAVLAPLIEGLRRLGVEGTAHQLARADAGLACFQLRPPKPPPPPPPGDRS
jgi:hypothetical protein